MNLNVKTKGFIYIILLLAGTRVSAQWVIKTGAGSTAKEVLVLPSSYPVTNGFRDIDAVKTGGLPRKEEGGFKTQLEKIAAKTAKKGGNVFRITRIEDHNQQGRYRFWGEAYSTKEYDRVKAQAIDKEKKKLCDTTCAYLTIYYPEYTQGFSGEIKYFITINDTLKIEIWPDSKYILKVAKAGSVKVSVDQNHFKQNINVDVKTGNSYYVRSYVNFPGSGKKLSGSEFEVQVHGFTPYLEKIDELQGEIESNMVVKYVVSKKI